MAARGPGIKAQRGAWGLAPARAPVYGRAMQAVHPPIPLPDPDSTAALGRALGARLGAGDTVLLHGGLGAGKTHLARALIQSLLPVPEDVPSPSFTLVQTYDGPGFEIWHADLYRLSGAGDVAELGLDMAMAQALTLIEWPDRLGTPPPGALHLALSDHGEGRLASLTSDDPGWTSRLRGLDVR
jgi:tRNA threonylcarbamoyladenosine biosynthesis protein TsaE